MQKRIVILGGGTGGTSTANRLRRRLSRNDAEIVVIDANDDHTYRPGLILVPFGRVEAGDLIRSRRAQLRAGVDMLAGEVSSVDTAGNQVVLTDGSSLHYDVLVVATGTRLLLEETVGLTGPGWSDTVHTFYTAPGAQALRRALRSFRRGRLVMAVADMPIACPVAPLEFCFLADEFFRCHGVRDDITIVYVTPLDGAFTKPRASAALAGLLESKQIEITTDFALESVDGEQRRLSSYDGRSIDFDLAVVVPLHAGASFVGRSAGLGDVLDFVMVDPHTLQAEVAASIFALGDATDLPTSKAGSAAHFQSEIVVENVLSVLRDEPPAARYDGHVNCFIETGANKAVLIDFNYESEPGEGHYPFAAGLPLLRESRLDHLGKMVFEPVYWHAVLPGRDIPGIHSAMPVSGKRSGRAATTAERHRLGPAGVTPAGGGGP